MANLRTYPLDSLLLSIIMEEFCQPLPIEFDHCARREKKCGNFKIKKFFIQIRVVLTLIVFQFLKSLLILTLKLQNKASFDLIFTLCNCGPSNI